jgi:DNA-binding NarL/FixJ family response regulator
MTNRTNDKPKLKPYRIFLVDDHAVVRQCTRDILNRNPQMTVVGEAESGKDLLGELKLKEPDLLLLDINLPGESGLALFEAIRAKFPALPIVFFTAHTDVQYILKARKLGADGYLSKMLDEQGLQQALLWVLQGDGPVYSHDVVEKLGAHNQDDRQSKLTPREMEVLLEVAQGKTNQAISEELFLSVKTVDTHVANLMRKLGLSSRSQLTAYAYEQELL